MTLATSRLVLIRLVVLQAILLAHRCLGEPLGCRDDQDRPVDWFIVYKIPKLEKNIEPFKTGYSYVYLTSESNSAWTLSKHQITDDTSIFANTLKALYGSPSGSNSERTSSTSRSDPDYAPNLSYIMYSDQPPSGKDGGNAHAKGVLALDSSYGYWLIHSVPKFPQPVDENSTYLYPPNAKENGQTAICISFNTPAEGDNIAFQLLTMQPKVYSFSLKDDVVKVAGQLDNLVKKKWTKKVSRVVQITTAKGTTFDSFSKSSKSGSDLYSELIAPHLAANLLVETWRKGAGTPLKSECDEKFHVNNVERVQLKLNTALPVDWEYTEDHAKWAISDSVTMPHICIGDINRMKSQFKRGGGSLCLKNVNIWTVLRASVEKIEGCPIPSSGSSLSTDSKRSSDVQANSMSNTDQRASFLASPIAIFVTFFCRIFQ